MTMFRDVTFTDVSRTQTLDETSVGFVMDEDAFRAFYDRNARGVWAYLARVTGDRHTADDLLQESFYRFLRASTVYDNEAHRRNSLYRIATNLANDARRRNVFRRTFAAPGDEIDRVASSGDHGGATQQRTDCSRALSQMKPKERAMLWLAYAEGASHREIADALGLSPASLKPLLFRARRKMADLLGRSQKEGVK
jgi:RNA polymerase sigma-70 factor, ECF subfamily